MHGLITDKMDPILLKLLEENNFEFDYLPNLSKNDLMSIINNYYYIIIRGRTKITKEILKNAENLKAIIRFGVGLDNVDIDYAKSKGILVFNTPEAFTEPVAELTLCLILGVLRGCGEAHLLTKKGVWRKDKFYGYELMGKTVSIIGFGRIGRRLSELLQPFCVTIKAYDILGVPEQYKKRGIIECKSLVDAVMDADIITIHVPLTKDTFHMINANLFKKMTKKPFIINTARGEIINTKDLIWALREGLIKGVALDVYETEPHIDKDLLKMDKVFLTPHIGAQTKEAIKRASQKVIKILVDLRNKYEI